MDAKTTLKAFEDLLELAQDLYGYCIDTWSWKYGEYWRTEMKAAKAFVEKLKEDE
jgi:hypothetical protein